MVTMSPMELLVYGINLLCSPMKWIKYGNSPLEKDSTTQDGPKIQKDLVSESETFELMKRPKWTGNKRNANHFVMRGEPMRKKKREADPSYSPPKGLLVDVFRYDSIIGYGNFTDIVKQMYRVVNERTRQFSIPTPRNTVEGRDALMEEYGAKTLMMTGLNAAKGQKEVFALLNNTMVKQLGCEELKFPEFKYVLENIVTDRAMEVIRKSEINQKVPVGPLTPVTGDVCLSRNCVCDYFHKKLSTVIEEDVVVLPYKRSGLLAVEKMEENKGRLVLECSDNCGCSIDCHRRSLQKGQQVPLVVFYKNEHVRFTAAAGSTIEAGQLIVEMNGTVAHRYEVKTDYLGMSFDIELFFEKLYLNVGPEGNAGRFMNHSCDPNAMYVQVLARESRSGLFKPRVGVYAIRRIEKGEEIGIQYFSNATENKHNKLIDCYCGAKNCIGQVPL